MAKQYVFLVHGTWGYIGNNDPKKDGEPWYEEGSGFAKTFIETLRLTSPDSNWEIRSFIWPNCGNIDSDRASAAAALAKTIKDLRQSEPDSILHFVAHSHGGNVVLGALARWFLMLDQTGSKAFSEGLHELLETKQTFKNPPTFDELLRPVTEALRRSPLSVPSGEKILIEACGVPARTPLTWKDFLRKRPSSLLGYTRLQPKIGPNFLDSERIFEWSNAAAACWVSEPLVNGIGRIVFLGTPFMHKSWTSNRRALNSLFYKCRQTSLWAFDLLIFLYALGLLVGLIGAIFTGDLPSLNPIQWPWWSIAVVMLFWLLSIDEMVRWIGESERYDTNVYFDLGRAELRRLGQRMTKERRLRCMVVTAQLFDEALLVLSIEPVVVGAFRPQLRKWLRLDHQDQLHEAHYFERGLDWEIAGFLRPHFSPAPIGLLFQLVDSLIVKPLRNMLWRPFLGPIVEHLVLGITGSVFRLTVTGLHPKEIRQGRRVVVANRIGVPAIFDEKLWDVTASALESPSFRNVARDSNRYKFLVNRYKFLVSDAGLPKPDERQFLFTALRNQGVTNSEMLKTALMVDERIKEAVGAVQLVHSMYYGNDEVIRAVATFVSTGIEAQIPGSTNHAPERSALGNCP